MSTPSVAATASQGAPATTDNRGADELLSGELFLQTLLGVGIAAPAADELAGEAAVEDALPEPGWLPFAAFVAAAVQEAPPKAQQSALQPGRGGVAAAAGRPLAALAEPGVSGGPLQQDAADPGLLIDGAMVPDALAGASGAAPERGGAPTSLAGIHALAASAGATQTLAAGRPQAEGTASPVPLQHQIHAPMHSPRWAEEVGRRVAMMAVNGTQSGSLSVVPEQLGPIEVRIHMSQDTANLWFGATQADTRAALQDALPRLREMFAESGLALGEAQVSQQAPRREGESQPSSRGAGYVPDDAAALQPAATVQRVSLGLVDTYA